MVVAIVGSEWNKNYSRLCEVMESQCYLFDVMCGGTDKNCLFKSAGYRWAIDNGAPVAETAEKSVREVDFVVIAKSKDNHENEYCWEAWKSGGILGNFKKIDEAKYYIKESMRINF